MSELVDDEGESIRAGFACFFGCLLRLSTAGHNRAEFRHKP
jgi:hypothetical protein